MALTRVGKRSYMVLVQLLDAKPHVEQGPRIAAVTIHHKVKTNINMLPPPDFNGFRTYPMP